MKPKEFQRILNGLVSNWFDWSNQSMSLWDVGAIEIIAPID